MIVDRNGPLATTLFELAAELCDEGRVEPRFAAKTGKVTVTVHLNGTQTARSFSFDIEDPIEPEPEPDPQPVTEPIREDPPA